MKRRLIAICGVWVLAFAVVAGADFWEEKAFPDWSDKDVEKLMNDSPWAKRVTVVFPRPPVVVDTLGSRGRGGGGGDFGQASPRARLVVQWRSALPFRQALLRERIGEGGEVDAEAQAALDQEEPAYYVVVTGVPGQFGRLTAEELMAGARIERKKGGAPILPAQAGPQRDGPAVALVYIFPKDEAITLENEEVEFIAKVGDTEVKKKFKLEDMVLDGTLEM